MNCVYPDEFVSTDRYMRRFQGAVGKLYLRKQAEFIIDCLTKHNCQRVVDVGAGHAQICNELIKRNFEVTCVVSSIKLSALIEKQARIIEEPILDYKPSEHFDAVIALKTLGHTNQPERFLTNLAGPARVIILDYPSTMSLARLSQIGFWLKKLVERHVRPFDPVDPSWIQAIMKKLGYTRVRSLGMFFFPIVLYRFFQSETLIDRIERFLNLNSLKSPRIDCYLREDNLESGPSASS